MVKREDAGALDWMISKSKLTKHRCLLSSDSVEGHDPASLHVAIGVVVLDQLFPDGADDMEFGHETTWRKRPVDQVKVVAPISEEGDVIVTVDEVEAEEVGMAFVVCFKV